MSVYLGCFGGVELKRDETVAPLPTSIDPSDVNVAKRRFTVDFNYSQLITGDRIEIATVSGSNLELVSGHAYPDGTWFIHIDAAGGIRLYSTFQDSITGLESNALVLVAPSAIQEVTIRTVTDNFKFVGQISDFELTTSRETVDLTVLGTEFRNQYEKGLVTGQGTLNCAWENDPTAGVNAQYQEFPSYLARLLLRVKQGADFTGRFFIHRDPAQNDDNVWYEADCVVTNVAVSVNPREIVDTKIDFVTSGQILLKQGSLPEYLLQEDSAFLLQEDGSRIVLED